jgi:hypothetical protein
VRALVYADVQAREGAERLFADPTVPLQRWRVIQFYALLKDIFAAYRCDALWDLGDTTDDRNNLALPTCAVVGAGLRPFRKTRVRNLKLIGNHEQWLRAAEFNAGPIFEHAFAHVIDVPAVVDVVGCDRPVTCLPFTESFEELNASAAEGEGILLAHCDLLGARLGGGVRLDGADPGQLGRYDVALCGHVHARQEVAPGVWYVGSPFQQNYGEAHDRKYVGIYDTTARTLEWVELTDKFPRYRVVTLAQFIDQVRPENEDRFQVTLRTPTEAATYYAHPLAGRAQPNYAYEVAAPSSGSEGADAVGADNPWTGGDVKSTLRAYAHARPPVDVGVELTDIIDYGVRLASGSP